MLALHNDPGAGSPGEPEEVPALRDRAKNDRAIVCAACGATITSERHRVSTHGAHEHRFMNPAGFLFHIGCFALAIGCALVGPASLEYAWFPGFAWRLARCGQCGQHLGWHFRNEGRGGFFGLILNRLRQPSEDGP